MACIQFCIIVLPWLILSCQQLQLCMSQDTLSSFQSVTNIRKITQQSLAPVIRKLEIHIQQVIDECREIKQQGATIKILTKLQEQSAAKADRLQKDISKLEDILGTMGKHHEEVKLDSLATKENFRLEIADLKKQLSKKDERLDAMAKSREALQKRIEEMNLGHKNDINVVQTKLGEVYRDTLNAALDIKSKYFQYDNAFDFIKQQTKQAKQKFTQSQKQMELYLSERQTLQSKMEHLYKHIFNHVSVEEFQKFRKYQSVELNATIQRIQAMLDGALTSDVRDYLPTVLDQAKEIDKISGIEQKQEKFMQEIIGLENKIGTKFQTLVEEMGKSVEERFRLTKEEALRQTKQLEGRVEYLQQAILTKVEMPQIQSYVKNQSQKIFQAIKEQQKLFESKLNSFINQNKQQIYDTVQSLVPKEQKQFWAKVKFTLPRIQQIQYQVQTQCTKVTELAAGLEETLERFSNRITKIKTDLELKDDLFATQIKFLKKNRQQHQRRFQVLGKLLSCQSEMLILLSTCNINELAVKRKGLENHLNQVFVSFSDGLVYELKLVADPEVITYRKKTIGKLDLMCASLTCFLSVLDSHFDQEFLCWQKYRPSGFFRANVLDQIEHEKSKACLKIPCRATPNSMMNPAPSPTPPLSSTPPPAHPSSALDLIENRDNAFESNNTTVLENMVNIVDVKDDSMEIFAKTTQLRRREFSRHRKLDQRYVKSGSQTSRLKSAQRSRQ